MGCEKTEIASLRCIGAPGDIESHVFQIMEQHEISHGGVGARDQQRRLLTALKRGFQHLSG